MKKSDYRSGKGTQIILIRIVIALALLLVSAEQICASVDGSITIQKPELLLGEQAIISLDIGNMDNVALVISSPTSQYMHLGTEKSIVFFPDSEGVYTVALHSGDNIIDSAEFLVKSPDGSDVIQNSEQEDWQYFQQNLQKDAGKIIVLETQDNKVNNQMDISLVLNDDYSDVKIIIRSETEQFVFLGASSEISFVPRKTGYYTIQALSGNELLDQAQFFVFGMEENSVPLQHEANVQEQQQPKHGEMAGYIAKDITNSGEFESLKARFAGIRFEKLEQLTPNSATDQNNLQGAALEDKFNLIVSDTENKTRAEIVGIENITNITAIKILSSNEINDPDYTFSGDAIGIEGAVIDSAKIRLKKDAQTDKILSCKDFDYNSNTCPKWEELNPVLIQEDNFVEFSVEHFSLIAQVATSGMPYSFTENIVKDSNGFLHIVDRDTSTDLNYWNSTDNGQTWNGPVEIRAGTALSGNLLIASNNTLYAIWRDDTYYAYWASKPEGGSWTTPQILFNGTAQDYPLYAAAAIDSNDVIHLCLSTGEFNDDPNNDFLIYSNWSSSQGWYNKSEEVVGYLGKKFIGMWVNNDTLDESDSCDLEVDSENNVYIVAFGTDGYDVDIWSSKDDFANRFSVHDDTSDSLPAIAIDPLRDTIHVAFEIGSNDLGYCNQTTSNWNGTWTCTDLDTDNSNYPTIEVTKLGQVFIMYENPTLNSHAVYESNLIPGESWDLRNTLQSGASWNQLIYSTMRGSVFPAFNRITDSIDYLYFNDTNNQLFFESFSVDYPLPELLNVSTNASQAEQVDDSINFSAFWQPITQGDQGIFLVDDSSGFTDCDFNTQSGCICSSSATTANNMSCAYTLDSGDIGTFVWYAQVCDENNDCDTTQIKTYTFESNPSAKAYEKNGTSTGPDDYDSEATTSDYDAINTSDASRWTTDLANETGGYDTQIYIFNISEAASNIVSIESVWRGYGENNSGYYTNLSLYNYTGTSWKELDNYDFTSNSDSDLSGALNAGDLDDFVNNTYMAIMATTSKYVSGGEECQNGIREGAEECDASEFNDCTEGGNWEECTSGNADCTASGSCGIVETYFCQNDCTQDCMTCQLKARCPFVFSWNGEEYVIEDEIMKFQEGKAKEDLDLLELKYLPWESNSHSFTIKELLPEKSFIDLLYLQINDTDNKTGRQTVYYVYPEKIESDSNRFSLDQIIKKDQDYIEMDYGEEFTVNFAEIPEMPAGSERKIFLAAYGHYEPYIKNYDTEQMFCHSFNNTKVEYRLGELTPFVDRVRADLGLGPAECLQYAPVECSQKNNVFETELSKTDLRPQFLQGEHNSLNTNFVNLTIGSTATGNFSVTDSSLCGDLTGDFNLTKNTSSEGTCFTVKANDITLDCKGYKITYGTGASNNVYGIDNNGYNGTTIKNCIINKGNPSTTGAFAIYMRNNVNNINVTNNTIQTLGTNSYGVYVYPTASNFELSNNKINSSSVGVFFRQNMNNISAFNNNITAVSYGFYIYDTGENNTVHHNTISSTGLNALAFYKDQQDTAVYLNNVSTVNDGDYAVYMRQNLQNFSVYQNNIQTAGSSSYAIYIYDNANNSIFDSNNISSTGAFTETVYIYISSDDIFSNNIITSAYRAFYFEHALNMLVANSTIVNSSAGSAHFWDGSDVIFLNTTFNKSQVSWEAQSITDTLTVQWYVRSNVTSSGGSPINLATVNISDVNGAEEVYTTTAASGFTPWQIVTEMVMNATTNISYNNHTINVTKSGFFENVTSHNITSSATFNATLFSSNNPPETPVAQINSTDGSNRTLQDLNCFAIINDSDGDKIDVTVRWYNNSLLWLEEEYTNSSSSYHNSSLFVAVLGYENTTKQQNWSCSLRFYDSLEYSSWGLSENLTIVNTPPTIPTQNSPADQSTIRTNYSLLNCSDSTDDDNDPITYYYFGDGTDGSTYLDINDTYTAYNWTDLSDDTTYWWKCLANDGEENSTASSVYNFTVSVNDAPTASVPVINPLVPSASTSVLNCSFIATDPDNSTLTYEFYWYNGTALYNNTNYSGIANNTNFTMNISPQLAKGEVWNCTVRAYDMELYSSNKSTNVTVANSPPTVPTSLALTDVNVTQPLTATCSGSTDADNDGITYYYRFYNMNDSTELIAWGTTNEYTVQVSDAHDTINVTCGAFDGTDYSQNFSNSTTVGNLIPTIDVPVISPADPYVKDDLNCSVTAYDGDDDPFNITFTWYRNGAYFNQTNISTTNNTNVSFIAYYQYTNVGENWTCNVSVSDGLSFSQNKTSSAIINGCNPSGDWVVDYNATCSNRQVIVDSMNITSIGNITLQNVTLIVNGFSEINGNFTARNGGGTIWQNGNLTVKGIFVLENDTLRMNVSSDGVFGINVSPSQDWGYMKVDKGANITNGETTAANYFFVVQPGKNFSMRNSVLEHVGWQENPTDNMGLKLSSTIAQFYNNTVYSSYAGVFVNAENLTIHNNTIHSSSRYGIEIRADNAQIINNTLIDVLIPGSGIRVFGAQNANISNNRLYNSFHGIVLTTGSSDSFAANNYLDTGGGQGIYLFSSDRNNLTNNTVINYSTSNDACINIYQSGDAIIKDSLLINCSRGFIIGRTSLRNLVQDTILTGMTQQDVYLDMASGTYTSNNTFLNVSFNTSDINMSDCGAEDTCELYVKWYMDVQVNNSMDGALDQATVIGTSAFGEQQFSDTTDVTGFITTQNATEFFQNASGKTYYTNYSIAASRQYYKSNSSQLNFSNSSTHYLFLERDVPRISQIDIIPAGTVFTNNTLNCTVTAVHDTLTNLNITITWYNSSSGANVYFNQSNISTTNNTQVGFLLYNITTTAGENWNCTAYANDGIWNSSVNHSEKHIYNAPPLTPVVSINTVDGSGSEDSDLNCSTTIYDLDEDIINLTVNWYLNGSLNLSQDFNGSYPSGSFFNATLGSGNTTAGDNWSCSIRLYDGIDYSEWGNSTNITIGAPIDLYTTSDDIFFSSSSPVEGENITINATIYNSGSQDADGLIVQFFEGDPDDSGEQIGSNITIDLSAGTNQTVNMTWIATQGTHNFYVLIDPPYGSGDFSESDETNNKANSTITIFVWQVFYGSLNTTVYLANINNESLRTWFEQNIQGNIYVSDYDTTNSISFTSLQAIGRNKTNSTNADSQDDFEEIDAALGVENFTGSVNETYTTSGNPKQTMSWEVYGQTLENVPYDNSTNISNFITGILWDTADSLDDYFDSSEKEDLVFITNINIQQPGKYSTYDYEIKVPANLRSYKGSTNSLTFYYEIK